MEWSHFYIKIPRVNFGNSVFDNWSEGIIKKIHIWDRMKLSLSGKKIIVKQILLFTLLCIGQIYTIPKYVKKEIEKRIYDFLWNEKKYDPPGT